MRSSILSLLTAAAVFFLAGAARGELVEYAFDIDYATVNYTGRNVTAMAVGGTIPAPLIEASVGDTLRVTFTNRMDVPSSIHWHGILLPNDQDGVPYLNSPPIEAGGSLTYEFPVVQSGTYWYHSHTGLQEQRGVYGPIVFRPREKGPPVADVEHVVVLSDWTDEDPKTVLSNLKKDDDYYSLKKGTVQSWDKVLMHGWTAVANRLRGSWSRMGPMDISDVGYDAFLANGEPRRNLPAAPGQTVLVRLINSAASTYFNVEFAGGPMTIVAADGPETQPLKVKRLQIAIAETYDLLIRVPGEGSYELRATSEDGTGHASVFIGSGKDVPAPDVPKPNLYLHRHHGHMEHEKMQGTHRAGQHEEREKMQGTHRAGQHEEHEKMQGTHHAGQHEEHEKTMSEARHREHRMKHEHGMARGPSAEKKPVGHMKDYSLLAAREDTSLPHGAPVREITLDLTGSMLRYTWSFDGRTLSQSDRILVRKGENVRFVLRNMTMMHHPLHLHGHFFRVLNGQGDRSPLKHTVDVPAMGTVTIEFAADTEKDWFFHCHNLYHMMAGMSRVISYEESSTADRELIRKISHDQARYTSAEISALRRFTEGSLGVFNIRDAFGAEYEYGYGDRPWEFEPYYERFFSMFLGAYAGARFESEGKGEKTEKRAMAGVRYLLPMFLESDLRIYSDGGAEVEFGSGVQLTSRAEFEWEWETDFEGEYEYEFSFSWEFAKKLQALWVYDSDHGWNAGVRFKF